MSLYGSQLLFNNLFMSKENVSDSSKGTTPPKRDSTFGDQNNESVDGLSIKAGDSMELDNTPPSEDREQVEGEETPINEVIPEADQTAEGTPERFGKVARELGERTKKLAEGYIELARNNETSKRMVLEKVESDPDLKTYFSKKFGTDYASKIGEAPTEPQFDEKTVREQERAKVKLEILEQQQSEVRSKQLDNFAQSVGFNTDEHEALKDNANILVGQTVGGVTLDWTLAIEKAALLVNQSKAKHRISFSSVGQEGSASPEPQKTQVTEELKTFQKMTYGSSRTPEDIAKGLDRVKEQTGEDGTFRLSLDD